MTAARQKFTFALLLIFLTVGGLMRSRAQTSPAPEPPPTILPPKIPGVGVAQGIVVRSTENVTKGGWVYLLNQCQQHGISRIDLLVKQDEDDFKSLRTGETFQSGELLVALPGEKTAAGWEDSKWLEEMIARAREMNIEIWAWFPCFHDAQMAAAFPDIAYRGSRGEHFVDAADPRAQARLEELLGKLLDTYDFAGVSLDWVRYSAWPDGANGPLGAAFARKQDIAWTPTTLDNETLKARWYEMRASAIADWVGRMVHTLHERRPAVRFGAFLLAPQFTELSQNYPMLARAGLDLLQPMGYWTDWKFPPQWVGESVIAPYARYAVNGTAFWPTLGIDSPLAEIPVALKSLPTEPIRGISWFTYGTWEQKTFDKVREVMLTPEGRAIFGYAPPAPEPSPSPSIPAATPKPSASTPPNPLVATTPVAARVQPKDFPPDTCMWSIVALGELYRRGVLNERNIDPVCPIIAFHTFAEGAAGTPVFLYKCSTAYLDAFLNAVAAAGFNVTPLSRLQNFLITGDASMLPPRPLVITLDDGSQSVVKLFAPRALQRRLPYAIALVTSWLSDTDVSNHATPEPGQPDPTMTWDEAGALYQSGLVEVISHSDGLHYQAGEMLGSDDGMPAETIRQFLVEKNRVETEAEYEHRIRVDMDTSRRKLIDHDFPVPSIFCWPYGEWTETAKNIARVTGFTHFLGFDPPPVFVSRDSAADANLPRVPFMRRDETLPLSFPTDRAEQQAWWLAFLKVARQSQSRTLLAATLAQLAPENVGHPQAEVARAALDMLNGNVAAGTERLMKLRRAHPFDPTVLTSIDQTLAQLAPGPRPRL
ncbi:MAG: polysaccharide deacetylase family protein [Verrucomicrobiota bacterium]|nr:polysaccharide deacetylase family protein [Verrucomicrobiota bacterium]